MMNSTLRRILAYGAGGHAKVVLDCANCLGWRVLLVDDNPALQGETLLGEPIRLASDLLKVGDIPDVDGAVIAIGDNRIRAEKAKRLRTLGIEPVTIIHPSAIIAASAVIGAGAQIMAGAIINADACVGENVILNTGCVVEHDCVVGECAHVAPNATLGGGVRVGCESLIGLGVSVLPGICVGANVTVGAGAVVTTNLADGVTAVGVPARVIRR